MAEIITYLTDDDLPTLVDWLNNEDDVAWLLKVDQHGCLYRWQAFSTVTSLAPGEYGLWHMRSQRPIIPSGSARAENTVVADPFRGWDQRLDHDQAQTPWFGAQHTGPFRFRYMPEGTEAPNSIGRSGFFWQADYFRPIGHSADSVSKKWWNRLKRFIGKQTVPVPWPPDSDSRLRAYVFPHAREMHVNGMPLDVNP